MPTPESHETAPAPRPEPRHESASPTTAEIVLQQALGSNNSDVRVPTLLLATTVLVAVVFGLRRGRRRMAAMAPGVDPPVQPEDTEHKPPGR